MYLDTIDSATHEEYIHTADFCAVLPLQRAATESVRDVSSTDENHQLLSGTCPYVDIPLTPIESQVDTGAPATGATYTLLSNIGLEIYSEFDNTNSDPHVYQAPDDIQGVCTDSSSDKTESDCQLPTPAEQGDACDSWSSEDQSLCDGNADLLTCPAITKDAAISNEVFDKVDTANIVYLSRDSLAAMSNEDGSEVEIGKGCFGRVLLGTLQGICEPVAAKYITKLPSNQSELQEAKILKYLEDTNVVPRLYGVVEGQPVTLVQEYFGGGFTIFDLLKSPDKLQRYYHG